MFFCFLKIFGKSFSAIQFEIRSQCNKLCSQSNQGKEIRTDCCDNEQIFESQRCLSKTVPEMPFVEFFGNGEGMYSLRGQDLN